MTGSLMVGVAADAGIDKLKKYTDVLKKNACDIYPIGIWWTGDIMRPRRFGRKCALMFIIGMVVVILLAPSGLAFYSTPNPPPAGQRLPWPGSQGNADVSVSVTQIDNRPANINMQIFTGGTFNNPQPIGQPPAGEDWVWVIPFTLHSELQTPPPWVSIVQTSVDAELNLIRGGQWNFIWAEWCDCTADAQNPLRIVFGLHLYLWDFWAQYIPGDIYHVFVYAQARYYDTNFNQWNSTTQMVDLFYLI